jgi:hypothetical protein
MVALAPWVAWAALVAGLSWPEALLARQNSINTTLSFGNVYESNVFRADRGPVSEGRSQVAPELTFVSKGLTDTLSLTYASELTYNRRRRDDETIHSLSFAEEKGVSSRWKVTVSGNYASYDKLFFEASSTLSVAQNFLRADSATQTEIVRILFPELVFDLARDMGTVLSQLQNRFAAVPQADQGRVKQLLFQGAGGARQQYWTGQLAVSSRYEFADKGLVVVGYRLASQDTTAGLISDHLGQTPTLSVAYQLNQQWRAEAGYALSVDTYDDSPDSTSNHPHLRLDLQLSPRNLMFWNYDYQRIRFAESLRDTTAQGNTIGWSHEFDQETSLTSTLGTSYRGYEAAPDEREYALDVGLNRRLERGSIAVRATGMTAVAMVGGGAQRSRQSWELSSDLTYQVQRELTTSARLAYGRWDAWAVGVGQNQNPYDQLQFGAGCHYLFARWFTLSLNYDYYLFDTNSLILNDYTEHLLSLKLVGAKELWRW